MGRGPARHGQVVGQGGAVDAGDQGAGHRLNELLERVEYPQKVDCAYGGEYYSDDD
jgi:hypothetical protein